MQIEIQAKGAVEHIEAGKIHNRIPSSPKEKTGHEAFRHVKMALGEARMS